MKRRSLRAGRAWHGDDLVSLGFRAVCGLLALGTAVPASAESMMRGGDGVPVSIDWVTVGDPGSAVAAAPPNASSGSTRELRWPARLRVREELRILCVNPPASHRRMCCG